MEVEFAVKDLEGEPAYEGSSGDWEPLVRAIIEDLRRGVPAGRIAARFHQTLANIIVAESQRAGLERVALTGGCFQNRCLTELAVRRLRDAGFRPYWHQRVPPNDGGVALGQLAALAALR
jgi:hydrogenase maturation protein HypF